MNKKYIDFVPGKTTKKGAAKPRRQAVVVKSDVVVRRVAPKRPATVRRAKLELDEEIVYKSLPREDNLAMQEPVTQREVNFGVIEDLGSDFTDIEVEKPPLTGAYIESMTDVAKEAKAKKIVGRRFGRNVKAPVEKPVEKSVKTESKKQTMTIPKSPFINQARVEKRPLSKNVYQKKVEAMREPKTGPVTIIAKPEKDKHVSVIVTIIITIILGAAAGTVAFLLLPK